ncbi:MAG: hypothetical protein NVS9B4_12680 [Candidatus Acidiferrum sp.]
MRRANYLAIFIASVTWLLLSGPQALAGNSQDPQAESSSKPTPATSGASDASPEPATHPKNKSDTPTRSAPDQPSWDPLRAEKDLEVGQYYLKKGDLDAALDRFEDAADAKPGYALPFRYLGETQEKKGMKRAAIKSYTRYLDLYPHAEDADKIRKKIDKLWRETEKKKQSSRTP